MNDGVEVVLAVRNGRLPRSSLKRRAIYPYKLVILSEIGVLVFPEGAKGPFLTKAREPFPWSPVPHYGGEFSERSFTATRVALKLPLFDGLALGSFGS